MAQTPRVLNAGSVPPVPQDGDSPARQTPAGRDAVACLVAGIEAVEPAARVYEFLRGFPLSAGEGELYVVALGKAAGAMARGALRALRAQGRDIADAVAVVPEALLGSVPDGVRAFGARHPVPDLGSVRGAEVIRDLARRVGEPDTLLVLISGGGSALVTLPPAGVSLADVCSTTEQMLNAGAGIAELNILRKHLDQLKGGRLARLASPARVLALVLSDVVGDPLDVIASGPVSPDASTFADALEMVDRYGLGPALPVAVREHLQAGAAGQREESPGAQDPVFERVATHIVGSSRVAAAAVLAEARRRGYAPHLLTMTLTGEAREAGRRLVATGLEAAASGRPAVPPAAILAAGETTVEVTGQGRGGRNQEVALGAALALDGCPGADRVTLAAVGTDGIDGPTDAAGAVADGRTVQRGKSAGVEARDALADNDAYRFFAALDDLVLTGPTGTNVMDLTLVLVR